MSKKVSFVLMLLVLTGLSNSVSALIINDPENVTYMQVELIQSGKIRLNSLSGFSLAEELRLNLYVPQNDSRQKSIITKVIGPNSYRMGLDGYGNAQIIMEWKNPSLDSDIDYLVETVVESELKSSGESRNFPVTELVQPSAGIIEKTYMLGGEERNVENMLLMGAWVHDHVEYDNSYEEATLSAKWVYENGKGVCDEYSNLLLSMLKASGYRAWYVAGYAFLGGKQEGETSFGAHAWVEVDMAGETYDIDPTWAESPVDATHITMARLPDSNFTEHTEAKSRDVKISWEKEETRLNLLDYREGPRVDIELEAIPHEVAGGRHALILADMSVTGCVLTNSRIASCIDDDGSSLLDIEEPKKPVAFCANRRLYWLAHAPQIKSGVMYTCPVNMGAGGAGEKTALSLVHGADSDIEISMSTQKILVPRQSMNVRISATNKGYFSQDLRFFAILGPEIKENALALPADITDTVTFSLYAPALPGDYDLYIFSDTGDLLIEEITVISERQVKITEIQIPGKIKLGDSGTINVTVRNFGKEMEASLKLLAGELNDTKNIQILENGTKVASFDYNAGSEGIKSVIISLLDSKGTYQDSWTGNIEVYKDVSFKDSISKQLENFFIWLWTAIRSIFGF